MTEQEFGLQMNRMTETFGKNAYGLERVRMIWEYVRHYPVRWFSGVVDGFISSSRQAPTVSEFVAAASDERDRQWRAEKAQNEREAKDFMQSSFSDDDKRTLIQGIVRRVTGQMPSQDWESFRAMLDGASSSENKKQCRRCGDSGVVFATDKKSLGEFVFRCLCNFGLNNKRSYQVWSEAFLENFHPEYLEARNEISRDQHNHKRTDHHDSGQVLQPSGAGQCSTGSQQILTLSPDENL